VEEKSQTPDYVLYLLLWAINNPYMIVALLYCSSWCFGKESDFIVSVVILLLVL
jgi:hypothetical protein